MLNVDPNGFVRPVIANQPMFQLAALGAATSAGTTGHEVEGAARPTSRHFPSAVPSCRYTHTAAMSSRSSPTFGYLKWILAEVNAEGCVGSSASGPSSNRPIRHTETIF